MGSCTAQPCRCLLMSAWTADASVDLPASMCIQVRTHTAYTAHPDVLITREDVCSEPLCLQRARVADCHTPEPGAPAIATMCFRSADADSAAEMARCASVVMISS